MLCCTRDREISRICRKPYIGTTNLYARLPQNKYNECSDGVEKFRIIIIIISDDDLCRDNINIIIM